MRKITSALDTWPGSTLVWTLLTLQLLVMSTQIASYLSAEGLAPGDFLPW